MKLLILRYSPATRNTSISYNCKLISNVCSSLFDYTLRYGHMDKFNPLKANLIC